MKMARELSFILSLIVLEIFLGSSNAFAQERGSNIQGGFTVGTATFNPLSPSTNNLKLNSGLQFSLYGLKALGIPNFHLVGAAQYLKTTGTLNYSFVSPSNIMYTANGVNFNYDNFNVLLGLRIKLFESAEVRPFVEGGATGGFTQFTYDNSLKTSTVLTAGSDYKTTDSVLDFSTYAEVGIEFQLTRVICLEGFARYLKDSTRALSTMNNQTITFEAMVYGGGINARF